MDSARALSDVPWYITYAAEPFELLKVIHPHLVNATLPPPPHPIRLSLERRATCDTGSGNSNSNNNNNNNGNNNTTTTDKKSSNTGVLVGAVVGSVVGTLAIAIIFFVVYKKRQRKKLEEKKTEGVNGAGSPFKDESAMATPFVVPGMTHTPPPNPGSYNPGMTGMNPEMHQFHNAMASGYAQPTNPHFSYMPPPSVTSAPSPSAYTGTGSENNYYGYAPPPPAQSPQPTINSSVTGTASTGISYYGSTPAPPFMNPHSTPSPPPPSGTPSNAGMQWAPWAVPSGTGNEPSTTGMFATAAEEKAHYSGREWPDEKAQYRSNTMSGKVGEGSRAGGSSTNLVREGENTVPADARDGARSPGVGITSDGGPRPGAMSPSPPAYSPQ